LACIVDIATAEKLTDARHTLPEEVLGTLVRLIRELRFGSIEIVVHEGRITQIERREKVRFAQSASARRE
jgi:hypothetical protein